ncbi:MAG: CDP-diacylglycerol--glycerol-3-phosphate 3-phosphatidyltransferase [Confluentimicrobium sp.]|jgi:CDP-diacylglycerol--glycerol-3-phosphate 3-phosphatidyltransferase|uniref:CDP-diacylglycerol--glycerol-3-phosphate 3-phosphatidyltransferase n=1 Tax=Actibacterium sp. TaxID=1872125 RepID=UPI00051000EC|nr:CDP-diacylglycerol--glycerol-3-phosphate 3-phosphatidyltransferase [Actibacterium sp.]KGB80618.1 CDP-diacylglycerol--glycerol-3-phosphate 3-phosphatidyltransferase [Rhodovulum sp. NI22]MBC58344.1 CDP-diacylglycerol--glycerol-3-phosphate 3-phosphatidyltransferase [Actibacterium sp.]|tara:strand:- start:250 stop:924 length:675 start_codon:yes stop_codon:yes gene_type:complete
MTWNIPNILTVLRLLAAPCVAIVFLLLPHPVADWVALILFVGAAVTDWFDGYIARKWNQQSRFGAMLDPIADKAMVTIALLTVTSLFGMSFAIMLPAALILFREVFVSGLREYLGPAAGLLQVTRLAKWKTTVQMVAIAVLLAQGLFEHYFGMGSFGMDAATVAEILAGRAEDVGGLVWTYRGAVGTLYLGVALLWLAAILTLTTGWDYFIKALPYLRDDEAQP